MTTDPTTLAPILNWLFQIGGPMAALCALFLYFYRKDMKQYTAQWQGQSDILIKVVIANTEAMTALRTDIHGQSLGRRVADRVTVVAAEARG